ncbi:hypothetical protein BC831DRAFT_463728 [Entophlyctis helioformis]|nr:hypothetical protein BC831DRAFT_463728 [Entophlyctis helioformis]
MAPSTTLRFLPLPGSESFISGRYGLEEVTVRGIVRVDRPSFSSRPLRISRLRLSLRGLLWTRFLDTVDTFDMVRRDKVLFDTSVDLLADTEIMPAEMAHDLHDPSVAASDPPGFDIPFEIAFPAHDVVTAGHGPAPQLLPPSSTVLGQSSSLHHYQSNTEYTLTAVLTESMLPPRPSSSAAAAASSAAASTSSSPSASNGGIVSTLGLTAQALGLPHLFAPPTRTQTMSLSPFVVFDPRLIPIIIHPDPRRWRSSPGASPVEYDIEVGPISMGPGDPIRFAYRMNVSPEAARSGVRVRKVSFVLKETHVVGEERCCVLDDRPKSYRQHKPPARVKGTIELLRWENVEYAPMAHGRYGSGMAGALNALSKTMGFGILGGSSSSSAASGSSPAPAASSSSSPPSPSLSTSPGKAITPLPRPGDLPGSRDGIHIETETVLHVPPLGSFAPTSPKPVLPDTDAICQRFRQRPAFQQVRHSIQVSIDFWGGADRISIESGVYLSSVGRADVENVLDSDPEILPTLDYDKMVGIEVWVPEYSLRDDGGSGAGSGSQTPTNVEGEGESERDGERAGRARSRLYREPGSVPPSDYDEDSTDDEDGAEVYHDAYSSSSSVPGSPAPAYTDVVLSSMPYSATPAPPPSRQALTPARLSSNGSMQSASRHGQSASRHSSRYSDANSMAESETADTAPTVQSLAEAIAEAMTDVLDLQPRDWRSGDADGDSVTGSVSGRRRTGRRRADIIVLGQ